MSRGRRRVDEPVQRGRARRKRRLWLSAAALAALALLILGLVLARRSPTLRHGAAHGLRSVLGPPAPPAEPFPEALEAPAEGLLAAADDDELLRIPEAELPPPAPPKRPPDLRGVSFVLLLGADNRHDRVVGRTDTMIVAAFRHRDGAVAAFSIPRDLWVPLPDVGGLHEQGRTHARVSSVVRVGESRIGPGQGLPLLRRTLDEQFGIRVDRYVSVDLAGFVALVDELDGVDVEVQCPIMDCFWTRGPDQPCEMIEVPAGRVHMDGATALGFVRSRHGRGDRDRTRRQQAVILAFAKKVRGRGLRGLPKLWKAAKPYLETDLSDEDAAYYASFTLETELSEVGGFAVRHPMTQRHVTEDKNRHVLLLDRERFDDALRGLFDERLPALRPRKRCPAVDAALTYKQ